MSYTHPTKQLAAFLTTLGDHGLTEKELAVVCNALATAMHAVKIRIGYDGENKKCWAAFARLSAAVNAIAPPEEARP